MLGQLGGIVKDVTKLTNHQGTDIEVYDTSPTFEAVPNGRIGIAWIRYYIRSSDEKRLYNLFFAVLDENGTVVSGPTNITNNTTYSGGSDADILVYRDPRLVATDDNKFSITWVEKHTYSGGKVTTDIKYAVYSSDGGGLKSPFFVTSFVANDIDGIDYDGPIVTDMTGGKVLLAYYQFNSATETNQILYSQFNSNGNKLSGPTTLTTGGGGRMDADQMTDGKIVLAWGEPTSGNIRYVVFNSDLSVGISATELMNPDQREAGSVSVTKDDGNHAILTWMDNYWQQRIYYTLVDASGTVMTPEIYKYGSYPNSILITSYLGAGNTTMTRFLHVNLPMVMK